MKRWLWLLPVFLLLASAFFGWNEKTITKEEYIAAKKKQSATKAKTHRRPASIAKVDPKPQPKKKQRQWVGNKEDIISKGRINFTNKPNKKWHENLKASLTRGLPSDTNVTIQPEKSLVMINSGRATNTEQVVVIFDSPIARNSYRAMVDSQSGKIMRTWDHTIHENIRQKSALKGLPLVVDPD